MLFFFPCKSHNLNFYTLQAVYRLSLHLLFLIISRVWQTKVVLPYCCDDLLQELLCFYSYVSERPDAAPKPGSTTASARAGQRRRSPHCLTQNSYLTLPGPGPRLFLVAFRAQCSICSWFPLTLAVSPSFFFRHTVSYRASFSLHGNHFSVGSHGSYFQYSVLPEGWRDFSALLALK